MRKPLALVFSFVGLFASSYLWWTYTAPNRPMVCLGTGCEQVRASQYAHLYGVPLPAFGAVFYLVLILLLFAEPLVSAVWNARLRRAVLVFSGAGVLFSAWLTGIEAFVLHAWCAWCVTQAIAVTVVFLLSLTLVRSEPYAEPGFALSAVRRNSLTLLVAFVVATPVMAALIGKEQAPPPPPPPVTPAMLAEHLVRPDSHVFGNPDAKLKVVEFSDLQCPFCGAAEKPAEELRAQYGSQIEFVFRQFPLVSIHPYAEKAAEASECAADQGKFWEAVHEFYLRQGDLSEASLRHQAGELGLDVNKFNQCLDSGAMAARVRRDVEDGNALGVRATPTFFIGQYRVQAALDFPQLAQIVNAELTRLNFVPVGPGGLPKAGTASPAERPKVPASLNQLNQQAKTGQAGRPAPAPVAASPATPPTPAKTVSSSAPAAGFGARSAGSSLLGSAGGDAGCDENGSSGTEPPMIRTSEALQLFRAQSLFVDIRPPAQFKAGRIAKAVNVPLGEIVGRADDLPKDKTIVVYESGRAPGEVCAASKAAARILMARGFAKVKVYQDGFAGWEKEKLPREP